MDTEFCILYVDDENHNLVSFKATFRKDYKILTAKSGFEGMELVRKYNVQLVISDQRMPGMTGVQFLEKVREEFPDIVTMILTGYSDANALIDAINTGNVFRYITKPWERTDLTTAIKNGITFYELKRSKDELILQYEQKTIEQERILNFFKKYVPESIVDKIQNMKGDDTHSLLEGELREATVLFCDVRGFTRLSERLNPKEVVQLLNDYYRIMTAVIKRYNGTVNQFVGDEIFAAFGAPIPTNNHQKQAVFCAVEMMRRLEELNEVYEEKLGEKIEMGIGINCGEVVAGNLGSDDKISYSLTGDTVNTGKRIESLTKEHPNSILISDSVYQITKSHIQAKTWQPIELKGKKNKITVHQLENVVE
ncbi:MAG: adenylate/guanylate cyclase domain-containing protein [Bacteroidota bacterium]